MGWWSTTILGGDEPLDYLGDFATICDIYDIETRIEPVTEEEKALSKTLYAYPFSKELVKKNLSEMEKACQQADTPSIAHQVLGVVLLATGSEIPPSLKKQIIKSAKEDDWAGGDEERNQHIQSFISALNDYKEGNPVYITNEGLFESLRKKGKI